MTKKIIPTETDKEIADCLKNRRSFSVIAGAGAGKTTSLIAALDLIRDNYGSSLRKQGQRIVCITYTNRAVEVITTKLGFDDLFLVSTLHKFLWDNISRFNNDIREALQLEVIPRHIENANAKDNGGTSKSATKAREKVARLSQELIAIDDVSDFHYDDATVSNYTTGRLNHDDIIDVAAYLILHKPLLRKVIGHRFPYIFVDEAQDTFLNVVGALNAICDNDGLPLIGYFGDPMQQIYDKRAGDFEGPPGSQIITKTENFRCSVAVIEFLNVFRPDLQQFAAGENGDVLGSVLLTIVQSEEPELPRRRYSDDQLTRAAEKFDDAIKSWEWQGNEDVKYLFLVRQMIARRLGFPNTHRLFTGPYASSQGQTDYEKGEHFLLKPFITTIVPIVENKEASNDRAVLDILRRTSPAFKYDGVNKDKSLKEMLARVQEHSDAIATMWADNTLGELLRYVDEHELCAVSERRTEHLARDAPLGEFDPEDDDHTKRKSEWLSEDFFKMKTGEMKNYVSFVEDNTLLSTQHGVKGEEYDNVVVVFDDVEAAWSNYSFTKTLTPQTSGEPTDSQQERSKKLAYVCFSRAQNNLRVLFFSQDADAARAELLASELLTEDQVSVI